MGIIGLRYENENLNAAASRYSIFPVAFAGGVNEGAGAGFPDGR